MAARCWGVASCVLIGDVSGGGVGGVVDEGLFEAHPASAIAPATNRDSSECFIRWIERSANSARDSDRYARREPPRHPVLHLPRELPARGVDVIAARLANRRHEPGVLQRARERADPLARAGGEAASRKRIERDQV